EYRKKELLSLERNNTWLMEAGSVDEWGTFDAFVEKVAASPLEIQGEDLIYTSPSIGRLELGWDRICTLNGRPVLEENFPLIENRYLFSEYGSGVIQGNLDGSKFLWNFRF